MGRTREGVPRADAAARATGFDPWHYAAQQGIEVDWEELLPPLRGFCAMWPDGEAIVLLDRRLRRDERAARCVLAEELGHLATCGHLYQGGWLAGTARTPRRELTEAKAMHWATERLMPMPDLLPLLRDQANAWQVADHFLVLPEFAEFRLARLKLAGPDAAWRAG